MVDPDMVLSWYADTNGAVAALVELLGGGGKAIAGGKN